MSNNLPSLPQHTKLAVLRWCNNIASKALQTHNKRRRKKLKTKTFVKQKVKIKFVKF